MRPSTVPSVRSSPSIKILVGTSTSLSVIAMSFPRFFDIFAHNCTIECNTIVSNSYVRGGKMAAESMSEGKSKPRLRRWMVTSLAVVVVLIATLVGWTLYQNTYDIREEKVTITGGSVPLQGVLALPEHGDGPFGLVVFVHGDGPVDATHETFYRPVWEAFAKAGYASLSWDKPGVNGAPGNWLDQSMDDRAAETEAAIEWARGRSDIDPSRIGLWGASQAGWVMPKVVNLDPDVAFVIAVGPAINWLQQGEFNTLARTFREKCVGRRVRESAGRSCEELGSVGP